MSALKRPQPPDEQTEAYQSFVLRVGPLPVNIDDPGEMTFRVQHVNRNVVEHFSDARSAFAFISAAIGRFAQRPLH